MPPSISLHLCPVFSPLCVLSLVHLSFICLSRSFLASPLVLSLHPSCRLSIPCVNNCLPTVVIAPPCQLEVWSKWQCAQFSLAYIVQFLVSLVPFAKKKKKKKVPSPVAVVLCAILISEPINMFVFHSDFSAFPADILLCMCSGGIYCLG